MSDQNDELPLGARLRQILEGVGQRGEEALVELEACCAPQMAFQDPLQTLETRKAFIEMLRQLLRRSRELGFVVHELVEDDANIFLSWQMSFRLGWTPAINIEGATHVRHAEGLIISYRDYWDLLSSFVETIPGAGLLYRRFASLLA